MTKPKSETQHIFGSPVAFEVAVSVPVRPAQEPVRILGLDLGTACGFALVELAANGKGAVMAGLWDLSLGPYDSGPLRMLRLQGFLELARPDLVCYEDVKYTPPTAQILGKNLSGILSRTARASELLGALKTTVTTWAEMRDIPAEGYGIGVIKKYATGRGNANKEEVIRAAIDRLKVPLELADWNARKTDNVADALWVAILGCETHLDALMSSRGS